MVRVPKSILSSRKGLGIRKSSGLESAEKYLGRGPNKSWALPVSPAPESTSPRFVLPHFKGQHQVYDRWCWAAVGSIISHYYYDRAGRPAGMRPWSQCQVANIRFGAGEGVDCCNPTSPQMEERCNEEHVLSEALKAVGHPHEYPDRPPIQSFNLIA